MNNDELLKLKLGILGNQAKLFLNEQSQHNLSGLFMSAKDFLPPKNEIPSKIDLLFNPLAGVKFDPSKKNVFQELLEKSRIDYEALLPEKNETVECTITPENPVQCTIPTVLSKEQKKAIEFAKYLNEMNDLLDEINSAIKKNMDK